MAKASLDRRILHFITYSGLYSEPRMEQKAFITGVCYDRKYSGKVCVLYV